MGLVHLFKRQEVSVDHWHDEDPGYLHIAHDKKDKTVGALLKSCGLRSFSVSWRDKEGKRYRFIGCIKGLDDAFFVFEKKS